MRDRQAIYDRQQEPTSIILFFRRTNPSIGWGILTRFWPGGREFQRSDPQKFKCPSFARGGGGGGGCFDLIGALRWSKVILAVPLDVVLDRRTERFSSRFWPGDHFC